MPDGTDYVAATAACVAAALVAWQSWETRKSAKASQNAAEAAAAGLETANNALDIARREEGHSRTLVSEAQRARIDATLPAVSVFPQREIIWPPLTSRNPHAEFVDWDYCEDDAAWSIPADARTALGIRGRIWFHNGSQKIVQFSIAYTPSPGGPRVYDKVVTLAPGEEVEQPFLAWGWIEQWIAADTEDAPALEAPLPSVVYYDQLDSGGSINWEFAHSHAPIYESNEAERGRYRLVTAQSSPGRVRPSKPFLFVKREHRSYWLSRKNLIELPAPGDAE
ncbi:hypothetical protein H9623_07920 [Oerskovia sp. Sa1BUA8]|uniref:Uncharacterized protein n=1 Tax=Oerskovia douganii TaxID=2762210 RepID=A0A9D5U9E7_9CELL|nr:hypothetical protein [Oerskovia douganii]MBE7700229.1 hypothetical protein [Oerskovia douganii]